MNVSLDKGGILPASEWEDACSIVEHVNPNMW